MLNKAVRENFVVVSIDSGLSMDANTHAIVKPMLDASNSSFWEMRRRAYMAISTLLNSDVTTDNHSCNKAITQTLHLVLPARDGSASPLSTLFSSRA